MSLDTTLPESAVVAERTSVEEEIAADWLSIGRFALLLGVLVFATFPGVLLGSQSFVFRDFGCFGYPLAAWHRESFWRGEVPLWNPFNYCGVPFLAQWNTMTLYPGSLIYLTLPMPWSLSFFCLAHLFWGGMGMFQLATNWTGHRLAGALAGIIFAFSGVMIGSLQWPSQLATFAWVPWVMLLVRRGWQQGGKHMLWGIVSGAFQMLAGGPETILLTWVVLTALAVGDWLRMQQLRSRIVVRFGGMVALVALLCGVQLLPFLQLLSRSQRDSGFGSAMWSLPGSGWANLLVPLFRMTQRTWGVYLQYGQEWISSYYAGIGTIFLSAVALRRAREWRVLLLAGLAVAGFSLALGENGIVYRALRGLVPALGFARFPVKFVLLSISLAPLLAAFGLKSLCVGSRRLSSFEFGTAAVLIVLIAGIVGADWTAGNWRTTLQSGVSRAAFLGLILLVLARYRVSAAQSRVFWGGTVLLVCWLDLITQAPSQDPTAAPSVYARDAIATGRNWTSEPRLGQSRGMASPQTQKSLYETCLGSYQNDYLIYRMVLFMDCNLIEDLPQAYGFYATVPSEINRATAGPFVWPKENFSPLFDFMGVAQVAEGANLDWTSRPTAMPMVTIGQKPVFSDDQAAVAAFAQTNTDFRETVFVPDEARGQVSAERQCQAQIVTTNFSNQKITIQTDSPGCSMVVISQTYYPAWKAYIDGRPSKLWRANYAFQALEVPAGRHSIQLRYEDGVFYAGAMISGLGILIIGLLWVRRR